jgi:hypothetical protein
MAVAAGTGAAMLLTLNFLASPSTLGSQALLNSFEEMLERVIFNL